MTMPSGRSALPNIFATPAKKGAASSKLKSAFDEEKEYELPNLANSLFITR